MTQAIVVGVIAPQPIVEVASSLIGGAPGVRARLGTSRFLAVDVRLLTDAPFDPSSTDVGLTTRDRTIARGAWEHFQVWVLPFGESIVMIGRSHGVDVSIPAPGVSARHAVLYPGTHGFHLLYDEKSKNGTFVDDARVDPEAGPRPLHVGARVRFGSTECLYGDATWLRAEVLGM